MKRFALLAAVLLVGTSCTTSPEGPDERFQEAASQDNSTETATNTPADGESFPDSPTATVFDFDDFVDSAPTGIPATSTSALDPDPTATSTLPPNPTAISTSPPGEPTSRPVQPTSAPAESTVPPLSSEYRNYEGAFISALSENGVNTNSDNPVFEQMEWHALALRNLYHLVTAPVGEINPDTTDYYEWLVDFIATSYAQDSSAANQNEAHFRRQFEQILHSPGSEIGSFFRAFEQQVISEGSGSSIDIYNEQIFLPGLVLFIPFQNPFSQDMMISRQQRFEEDYSLALFENESQFLSIFDYVAENPDHYPLFIEDGSASNPPDSSNDPTAPEQSIPDDGIPEPGDILYDRPLTEWFEEETEEGWFSVEDGTFQIGMHLGEGRTRETWTAGDDFDDISATVWVQATETASNSAGCIVVRQDVDLGEYQLCMLSNGGTWATYDYIDADGIWQQEELLAPEVRTGTHSTGEWNELQIIARDDELWFLANGTLLGQVNHDGRASGHVAIQVTNWGMNEAVWNFDGLVIRDIP